jgi:protein HIRA/HIR1
VISCNAGGADENKHAVLEIRNGTGNEQEPTRIIATKEDQVLFIDFLPRHGHLATGQEASFWVVATEDGTLHFYSATGRRLMPSIVLGASVTILESQGSFVLAITSIGMVHVWNIDEQKALFAPVSLAPVLDSATKTLDNGLLRAPSITQAAVTSHGAVVVTLNNGSAYTYSHAMVAWHRISEQWWAIGSQYWDSTDLSNRASTNGLASGVAGIGGIVGLVERRTNAEVVLKAGSRGRLLQRMAKNRMLQEGYEAFESVLSVGHLENRVVAAVMLQSTDELRRYLSMYARRLAEEGLKDRLDELCNILLGPTLMDSTQGESSWKEELCGINKHDLLKDVIAAAAKNRDVQSVLLPYAAALGIVGDFSG